MTERLDGSIDLSTYPPRKCVHIELGTGWQWITRDYVSRLELHNVGTEALYVDSEQDTGRIVLRVRAEPGADLERAQINDGLQAAAELARAVITAHGRAAAELAGSELAEDFALLAACARDFTAALDALPSRNRCCGNTGRHSEGGREFCSTCGQESPAKRWL